jgi:hypothetical protein
MVSGTIFEIKHFNKILSGLDNYFSHHTYNIKMLDYFSELIISSIYKS